MTDHTLLLGLSGIVTTLYVVLVPLLWRLMRSDRRRFEQTMAKIDAILDENARRHPPHGAGE